jgi:hypothetical protein
MQPETSREPSLVAADGNRITLPTCDEILSDNKTCLVNASHWIFAILGLVYCQFDQTRKSLDRHDGSGEMTLLLDFFLSAESLR